MITLAALLFVTASTVYQGTISVDPPLTSQRDTIVHIFGFGGAGCHIPHTGVASLQGKTLTIQTVGYIDSTPCFPIEAAFKFSVNAGRLPAGIYDVVSDLGVGIRPLHVVVTEDDVPDPELVERFLIPPLFDSNGAFGAHWVTDAVVLSDNTVSLGLFAPTGKLTAIPPRTTDLAAAIGPHPAGLFLFVPRDAASTLHFGTTVREASRDGGTFGATIPVARESDFRTSQQILNVPYDPRYRLLLRIFGDFTRDAFPHVASVMIVSNDDKFGAETEVELLTPPGDFGTPPSATIDLAPLLAKMPAGTHVRVEAGSMQYRIWAFITLTNNDTQHVTAYVPD